MLKFTSNLIILATLTSALASCGIVKEVACGLDERFLCRIVDGETNARLDRVEDRSLSNAARIKQLEERIAQVKSSLSTLLTDYGHTATEVANLQAAVNQSFLDLGALQVQLSALEAEVDSIPRTVVRLHDPCPHVNSSAAKEMLIEINGEFLAYFEIGSQRFLSKLTPGVAYRTTDARACVFNL
jgi:DNA repair ATPase RecN